MSLQSLTARITQKLQSAGGLRACVKFDFGAQGLIFVDTTQDPPHIHHEDQEADTTLICTLETLEAILDGKQDPNIAFMTGKLKIKGSMGLAMKLSSILED